MVNGNGTTAIADMMHGTVVQLAGASAASTSVLIVLAIYINVSNSQFMLIKQFAKTKALFPMAWIWPIQMERTFSRAHIPSQSGRLCLPHIVRYIGRLMASSGSNGESPGE